MGILPVLVLLAGKMPAPQEILGYFFIWKSLRESSSSRNLTFGRLSLAVRSHHQLRIMNYLVNIL
jgi:drug/metabolite transporter superfamily protein YnfA